MALAAEPTGTDQVFERATILSYGSAPPGCGVLAWGQVLNIRTQGGETVEIVVVCPEMHKDLPKVGQVCDITYETAPANVLVGWPDGRRSSTNDPTPYPKLIRAICPPA